MLWVQQRKQTVSLIASIIVSVFLISGIVVAATTIGSSLSTDGNLTVLGNAGIGTSTPSARFSVTGDGTGATRGFVFADSGNTERFTILNNGNVGIGTTTPTGLLNIAGTTPKLYLSDTSAGVDAKHWFLQSSGGKLSIGTTTDSLSSNATYMTVTNAGNIGIGTTTPVFPLELNVSGGGTWNGVPNQYLAISDTAKTPHLMTTFAPGNTFGAFRMASGSVGGFAVRGLSSGDTSALWLQGFIGSTAPTNPAVILTGSKHNGGTSVTSLASGEIVFQIQNNGSAIVTAMGSGNLGIGTTTP